MTDVACDHSKPPKWTGVGWAFDGCGHPSACPEGIIEPTPAQIRAAADRAADERLDALLTTLRRHGVQSYGNGDTTIVLYPRDEVECGACGRVMLAKVIGGHVCPMAPKGAPPVPSEPLPVAPTADEIERDKCACGHSTANEHNAMGCLYACSHELCSSKDGLPPSEDAS